MPTATKVTQADVCQFFKQLVELGGVYRVDEVGGIFHVDLNTPIKAEVHGKNKQVAFRIFSEHMESSPDWTYINPLSESVKQSNERVWFWSSLNIILGAISRQCLQRLVQAVCDNKVPVELLDLSTKLVDIVDSDTVAHLKKIQDNDFLNIIFDAKEKVAQVSCNVLNEEWRGSARGLSCMRKKDWEAVRIYLNEVFGDPPHQICHRGSVPAIIEADARLQVLIVVVEKLDTLAKILLNVDLKGAELRNHYQHIEEYQKCVAWFMTSSQAAKPPAVVETNTSPWRTDAYTAPRALVAAPIPTTPPPPQPQVQYSQPAQYTQPVPQQPPVQAPRVGYQEQAKRDAARVPSPGVWIPPAPSLPPQPQQQLQPMYTPQGQIVYVNPAQMNPGGPCLPPGYPPQGYQVPTDQYGRSIMQYPPQAQVDPYGRPIPPMQPQMFDAYGRLMNPIGMPVPVPNYVPYPPNPYGLTNQQYPPQQSAGCGTTHPPNFNSSNSQAQPPPQQGQRSLL